MADKTITMTLNGFKLALFGDTGCQNNQIEVLKLIIQAFDEEIPFYLIDESSKKYRLSKEGKLIEIAA